MAHRRWLADLSLVGIVAVWGYTFVTVKEATETVPVFTFLLLRFGVASLAFVPFLLLRRRAPAIGSADRGAPSRAGPGLAGVGLAGVGVGILLGLGYVFQTFGLAHTTPARSGVITGMSVVLVPFGARYALRQRVGTFEWIGVLLAVTGFLLLGTGEGAVGIGELLVLGCAVAFAAQIVALARVAPGRAVLPLAAVQVVTVAVALVVPAAVLEWHDGFPAVSPQAWFAVGLTGLVATTGGFAVQTWAQKITSPTHVALILALEPVFAMGASRIWTGELLTGAALAGAACIVLGMLTAEFGPIARSPSAPLE